MICPYLSLKLRVFYCQCLGRSHKCNNLWNSQIAPIEVNYIETKYLFWKRGFILCSSLHPIFGSIWNDTLLLSMILENTMSSLDPVGNKFIESTFNCLLKVLAWVISFWDLVNMISVQRAFHLEILVNKICTKGISFWDVVNTIYTKGISFWDLLNNTYAKGRGIIWTGVGCGGGLVGKGDIQCCSQCFPDIFLHFQSDSIFADFHRINYPQNYP